MNEKSGITDDDEYIFDDFKGKKYNAHNPNNQQIKGNPNKFIFFGCWNKGGCKILDIPINPLEKMISKLKDYIAKKVEENDKPGFMIVAGDNYYPNSRKDKGDEKKTKVKEIIKDELESGFNCLNTIDISKRYILLGNHDVDGVNVFSATEDSKPVSNVEICPILDFQVKKFKNRDTTDRLFTFNNDRLLEHYIDGHTAIIMFDSTILFHIDDKDVSKFLSCYNLIYNTKGFTSIESIITFQNLQRNKTIAFLKGNETITNIIFACHHPIVSLKSKKKDGEIKKNKAVTKKMVDFLFPFYENFPDKHFIHLCADVHLYQHSQIEIEKSGDTKVVMKIEQYVVGTGGADLDDPYGEEKIEPISIVEPRELLQNIISKEESDRRPFKPNQPSVDVGKAPIEGSIVAIEETPPAKCAYPSEKPPKIALVPCQTGGASGDYVINCSILEEQKGNGFLDCDFSDSNEFKPTFIRTDVDQIRTRPVSVEPIQSSLPESITHQQQVIPDSPPLGGKSSTRRTGNLGGRRSKRKLHKKRISKKKNKKVYKRTLRK